MSFKEIRRRINQQEKANAYLLLQWIKADEKGDEKKKAIIQEVISELKRAGTTTEYIPPPPPRD